MTAANIDTTPIYEALRELRARMEGFKHYGDGWSAEEQEAAEAAYQALLDHEARRRYGRDEIQAWNRDDPNSVASACVVAARHVPMAGQILEDAARVIRTLTERVPLTTEPSEP